MAVLTFKCPNCGGEVTFNPSTQQYDCAYCFSHFSEAELQQAVQSEQKAPEQQDPGIQEESQQAVVYNCPSCGAEIVTDETTAATFCYYCHNPVILSGKLDGSFLPNKIVPFEITNKEVKKIFLKWVGTKKFVPKNFFSKEQIKKISGIYFPYWVMDCDVDAAVRGQAANVRTWVAGDLEYTETTTYDILRKGTIHFEDLSKNALKKANKKLVEGVMPFKTRDMKPFTMGYLSGFQAEKRDMEQEELQEAMNAQMEKYADILLRESVSGYSTVKLGKSKLRTRESAWEYVLLPVWVLTYHAADKLYYFALNGQTKKICGELPLDRLKLALFSGSISAVLFVLLLIGGWFL